MSSARRVAPKAGQESVWDYPRPPRLEASERRIRIVLDGTTIVDVRHSWRILETSHPPVYYLARAAFAPGVVHAAGGSSFCEFKGRAEYLDLRAGTAIARRAAWTYPDPASAYRALAGHVAVYASRVDACYVDDERVQPQAGDFYGGWVTRDVVGPFKGGAGTFGW